MRTSTIQISLVFLVFIAILAPSITTCMVTETPSSLVPEDLSFSNCTPSILEAAMCVVSVIKLPTDPHPSYSKVASELNDCSPKFINIFLVWMLLRKIVVKETFSFFRLKGSLG